MYFHSLNFNKILIIVLCFGAISMFSISNVLAQEEPVPAEESPADSPASEVDSSSSINTGPAVAETEILNNVNANETQTELIPQTEIIEETEENGVEINAEPESADLNILASSTSSAEVLNISTTSAETGNNISPESAFQGEAVITTGVAYASANIINVVNTNIFNSRGFLYLLNNFLGGLGSIDLRLYDFSIVNPCSSPCGENSSLRTEIQGSSTAAIMNNMVVRAGTGENTASGTDASINTGNAYAGANVVNIANTNIINSNYLMFVFNNFGDWSGDLVFNNSDFFASFFNPHLENNSDNENSGTSNSSVEVENNNTALIENDIETESATGENTATGTDSLINSGDAVSNSNVSNTINQNIFGKSNFILIFRIFGSWSGNVFNTPGEVVWSETQNGLELYGVDNDAVENNGNGENNEAGSGNNGADISSQNTANINNNVKVFALTGKNKVSGSGNASINTGNAYAGVNTVNIANTNIVSSNWILAIVNIFGNWGGNVSFGQPDLWIASRVESGGGNIGPGSTIIIRTTVANRGDANAHDILLEHLIDNPNLVFIDEESSFLINKKIPLLRPGQTIEYVYQAQVNGNLPQGDIPLRSALSVNEVESDGNPEDNRDELFIMAYNHPLFIAPLNLTSYTTTYPNLSIIKTNDVTGSIEASSTVNYVIKIKNNGGDAFESILFDELKDEKGAVISKQKWEFGTILAGEEINVTYTAIFSSSTASGIYTNYAWVEALGGDYLNHWSLAKNANSPIATTSVVVELPLVEELSVEANMETENPMENLIATVPAGTLRTGPQTGKILGADILLELDIPKKNNQFNFKKLITILFSIVLLMRPIKREDGMMNML